jgi:hypothetical protein
MSFISAALSAPASTPCPAPDSPSQRQQWGFAGGRLGVVVLDYPLMDNLAGTDDRDPEWCLTRL